jgi:hypothetical protein
MEGDFRGNCCRIITFRGQFFKKDPPNIALRDDI